MPELNYQLSGLDPDRLPRTVAFIPDGNVRWATQRGLTTEQGHAAAAAIATMRVRDACELGIEQVSVYGFSTENWSRPSAEVDGLMNVFARHLGDTVQALDPCGVQIRLLGSREGLPQAVVEAIDHAEAATEHNNRMSMFIAINYGGRQELLDAARRYCGGGPELFRQKLYAPEMRDLDLIIRTGGERRLSNAFPWHSTFSELVFLDELWPDFTRECFEMALADYAQRVRSMGGRAVPAGTGGTTAAVTDEPRQFIGNTQ